MAEGAETAGTATGPVDQTIEIQKAAELKSGVEVAGTANDSVIQTKSMVSENTTEVKSAKTDRNEQYSLHVKSEFILTERSAVLVPVLERTPETREQDRSEKSRKKKKRGLNKKRPRDVKDTGPKMCREFLQGECPFNEEGKCKYSHDIKEALANRPPDIVEVEGGCPHFNLKGFCPYGLTCRVGSCHLNLATGKSERRDDVEPPAPLMNIIPRELQNQLRKNQYPFKCKRHFEKKSSPQNENVEKVDEQKEAKEAEATDFSPLPTKRKLIDFRNRIYVAPLTTVGNLPFRRIMKKFGADITCGEMSVCTNLLMGRASEWSLMKRHPEEDIFGVQIAAGHPDQFTRVCEVLEAHTTVDFVDLNLGCPLDMVCDRGAGAKLMQRDKKLRDSLKGITATLSCPVTIKIRTGWDEGKPFAHKLVPKIQSWGIEGVAAIMVHGRSRLQRYQKAANWEYISEVATSQSGEIEKIPVIGNGDIYSFTEYEEKIALEGINATAMLGRGALIKPWLPTEIKERRHWDISASERLDMLKEFVKMGLEHWGSDQQGVNTTRRFLLEWLSFLYRYVPVGMLEVVPSKMNQRPPSFLCGRSDLETLMLSNNCMDWIKISELLLGKVPDDFQFEPKHKANAYK